MPSSAIRSRHSLPLLASIALALAAAPGARAELLNEPPVIRPETLRQVAPGVSIIPDPRINYVPNIGIVEGRDAILVVDTGMGPANGRLVYDKARAIARGRRIYLTTTHFHPEHSFGASAFPASDVIQNRLQAAELAEKGMPYARLFSGFGANERAALEGVEIVKAGISYTGRKTLDLGGRIVILQEMPAHTRGDQIVFVPDGGVLFTGDLVEDRFFPIMPDADAKGSRWIAVLGQLLDLKPSIVVPGHGSIGDAALIRTVRDYLTHIRTEVFRLVDAGKTQDEIAATLEPQLKALHPDWDNATFIPFEVGIFFAERTGRPPQLPKL